MARLLYRTDTYEGDNKNCLFDVLIKNYDSEGNNLLVEVKSTIEIPHIRMAVGQLYNYWYTLNGDSDSTPHLALLLPEKPAEDQFRFLNWLDIGILWFEGDQLYTENEWLKCVAN